jgi:hypothetical protein
MVSPFPFVSDQRPPGASVEVHPAALALFYGALLAFFPSKTC